MNSPTPHYLLKTEASREGVRDSGGSCCGRSTVRPPIEAADVEPDVWGERLDLLTAVRALESLDQPSWVTLVGCTRYVEQGILYGIAEWKENDWRWECFGQMVPGARHRSLAADGSGSTIPPRRLRTAAV